MAGESGVVRVAPVTQWEDAVIVMGTRGDPAFCWCQYFRQTPDERRQASRRSNREALRVQVDEDPVPPGVIAYMDEEPVGWCAVAPKGSYPRVLSSRVAGPETDDVWSVVCFVVRVGWRRRGVGTRLLQGAVDLAKSHGAKVVEGYPVDLEKRKSVSSSDLYHGTLSLFLQAGFREVSRPTDSRVLVKLPV